MAKPVRNFIKRIFYMIILRLVNSLSRRLPECLTSNVMVMKRRLVWRHIVVKVFESVIARIIGCDGEHPGRASRARRGG
jgi:hypothetical protein